MRRTAREPKRRTLLFYIVSLLPRAAELTTIFALASPLGPLGCKKGSASGSQRTNAAEPLTPGKAIAIPPARGAYVTNNASDSISVLDRDGDAVVAVSLDLVSDEHEAPHHLALDAASKKVFVALAFPEAAEPKAKDPHASHGNASNAGKLAQLDLDTLAIRDTREVDENPGDVVLTHDRTRVLVTHFDMKRAMDVAARGGGSPATMFAHLVVFDARDMRKLGTRPVCVAPHGVTTTSDDKTAFVACYGSDELAVVDLSTEGFPVARIPLGSAPGVPGVPRYGPYSATLSPDEARVVLADLEGQDLRIFDRASKRFVTDKTIPLSAKAFMPAFVDAHTVLVPLQSPDGLALVDIDLGKTVRRTSFPKEQCALPHVVRVARDGRVYLVCEGDHRAAGAVLEVDKTTLGVKRRWSVGAYPDGIVFGDE